MVGSSLLLLLGFAMVAVVLIIGAIAFSLRSHNRSDNPSEQKDGGNAMIKTVYTYLILFATLMMTIGGSVAAFMAAADLVAPQSYYVSFEDYKQGKIYEKGETEPSLPAIEKSDEELKADYQRQVDEEKARSRERALNSLIKSFGWIVIPLPVFLYYQRRLRAE
ncbi:hypothetical protein Desdi_2405 [Desulfitobacterium dichloroeliminans LMG P-21439]|uniref:DUF5671 domain-containing protein n=1 Tax=Desulfitobacterium dichloroeliminans (strain LMG P-21439 / DCA1) TaxID=871963 RepID=L0F7L0_DESDL|nr:hypothetical protein [Desulfitobacterium dichloroeliminans]AGA69829.1 hypothetical protein Desdi_2405 [Desulfitobacterium dichloroeliminans LMG P-21439]